MLPTPKAPTISPLDVARRMMRAHSDPGLIAAYLRLELERDPTIGMTPMQRIGYAAARVGFALQQWQTAWLRALRVPNE